MTIVQKLLKLSNTLLKWTASKLLYRHETYQLRNYKGSSIANRKQQNSLTVVLLTTLKLSNLNGHLNISLRNVLIKRFQYIQTQEFVMLKYSLIHSLKSLSDYLNARQYIQIMAFQSLLMGMSVLQMQTLTLKVYTQAASIWQYLPQKTALASLSQRYVLNTASIQNQQQKSCHWKSQSFILMIIAVFHLFKISQRRARTL
ncbi:hypothetical protein FGO68_gene16082 [Halteria grandinella]|uniref:Uncharacterized protein n=1 Tax=Halteria grandinella TaxID=5974 RepID=A0A8J8T5J7_HALGN|nr:hypothetical protein FGO68_gene16082 [Halteria grandinella]